MKRTVRSLDAQLRDGVYFLINENNVFQVIFVDEDYLGDKDTMSEFYEAYDVDINKVEFLSTSFYHLDELDSRITIWHPFNPPLLLP